MEPVTDTGLSHKGLDIPLLPNLITLTHENVDQPWTYYLLEWENIIFSILVVCILTVLFFFSARKKQLIPSGFQNFAEWIVELLEQLIVGVIGPTGRQYLKV